MSKEAMKLALEALEHVLCDPEGNVCWQGSYADRDIIGDALQTFREALALVNEVDQEQPAQQEPVALFEWLPEGATHIGHISVRTAAGGSLAMTTHAFKYDSEVLKVYVTDNDNEYAGWRDAKDCFFHLNFPVLPLYTSPPTQRTWVHATEWRGLTDEEIAKEVEAELTHYWNGEYIDTTAARDQLTAFARAIEAKLREKNT